MVSSEAMTKDEARKKLMSLNVKMFAGTIRVLSEQNKSLHEQVSALMDVNDELLGQIATLQCALMDKIAEG
jgi:hypothetical protein